MLCSHFMTEVKNHFKLRIYSYSHIQVFVTVSGQTLALCHIILSCATSISFVGKVELVQRNGTAQKVEISCSALSQAQGADGSGENIKKSSPTLCFVHWRF